MKLIDSIDDYLRYLRHEQGATLTTYKCYGASLRHFHHWLIQSGYPEPTLSNFNAAASRRFFYQLSERGLRPRTLYGYMVPLRFRRGCWVRRRRSECDPGSKTCPCKTDYRG